METKGPWICHRASIRWKCGGKLWSHLASTKESSYQEVATDKTLWDYRKWVRTHINQRTSKGAALDFAKYLKAHDARHGQVKQMPVIPGTEIPRQFKEDDP